MNTELTAEIKDSQPFSVASLFKDEQSLRRASLIAIGALIIVLLLLAATFVMLLNTNTELSNAENTRVESYLLANELRQNANDLDRMARNYVVTADPEYLRQYNTLLSIRFGNTPRPELYHHIYWDLIDIENPTKPRPDGETIALSDLMKQAGFTEEEFAKLDESLKASEGLSQIETRAFNAVKGLFEDANGTFSVIDFPNKEFAEELLYGQEFAQERIKALKPIDDFFTLMENRTEAEVLKATSNQRNSQFAFFGLLVLSLIMIALVGYIGRLQAQMQIANRAKAQEKAEKENEQLNDSVISILQSVQQLSQRDLTARAPVTEDIIGTVSDSINYLTDETSNVLKEVTQVAGQVQESSIKVQDQAGIVSQTAEQERESVNNMVESLFEATQTMNRVAALAEESNIAAEQATEVTDNALETVTGTVLGMESIRETIAETEKRIKRLGERSQEISGIVNLINTISERTHVLALNASMQAAVAGEAGRGFAVVAEEVQRLAESSRNATQQIASLVGNIQIETNETINTVNNTIAQVVDGSAQAQKAGEQMRETQQITQKLVEQVRSIANASEQQKSMSAELLEAVQKIGESTEQTAQQIEAQNQETSSLQDAAQRLVESVGVFKLPS